MSAIEKQLEDFGGGITHHFSDGLYAKEAFVPAGTAILKHTHDFSHLSILAKGKVFCIHATDEKDPAKVDDVLIKGY